VLLLLSAAALAWGVLAPVVLGLDAAALLLIGLDFALTPAPARLRVERRLPERARLGLRFERVLAVTAANARRARRLRIEVHEEFPVRFEVVRRTLLGQGAPPAAGDPSGGKDSARFGALGRVELVRAYRSQLRGTFALGDLRLCVVGPLGLVARQARFAGSQELAVEPALLRLRETLQLAASERWQDLGLRRLRRHGGEREFESLREYVAGDEVRRVDWKAFARRAKPMVRTYQVERGQELILCLDAGRRMRIAGSEGAQAGWTKLDWALDAALQLAAVALSKGDRVGAAAFDRRLCEYVPPARGARTLARLSSALFSLQPGEDEGDLARALRELAVRHRRRATVIVLSDVADPLSIEEQRRALASASRRHRLVFAALDDPALRAAAEGRRGDAALRAASGELVAERARSLRRLAASGARVLDALPAEAAAPLLAAWLDERRAG
jgi:uncharacterized protein (DUF58 family)